MNKLCLNLTACPKDISSLLKIYNAASRSKNKYKVSIKLLMICSRKSIFSVYVIPHLYVQFCIDFFPKINMSKS